MTVTSVTNVINVTNVTNVTRVTSFEKNVIGKKGENDSLWNGEKKQSGPFYPARERSSKGLLFTLLLFLLLG
jgi:hypothetical protein